MDRLALTNTNRVRSGVQNLGVLKVVLRHGKFIRLYPYVNVEIVSDGLTPKNIATFFRGLDIVVDEIDNLALKYLIREHAKKSRIAVVMAADNGDNSVVDIERYDLNPKIPFFHGRMGKVTYAKLAGLEKFGIGKMITKHVGPEECYRAHAGFAFADGQDDRFLAPALRTRTDKRRGGGVSYPQNFERPTDCSHQIVRSFPSMKN